MSPPNLHNANILASFQTLTFSNVPEHVEPTWLPVDQGKLPSWLNGTMYRVGGGRFNLGDDSKRNEKGSGGGAQYTVRHAFDGLPFLYRFEFNGKNNSLRFNSKYIAKDMEKNILARKGKGAIWFGESRKMSTWERIKDFASRFDQLVLRVKSPTPSSMSIGITTTPNYPLPSSWKTSSNGHVALVTKSDHNALQQLDHDTLEPQKIFTYRDYHKQLNGQLAAAHHQYDYDTKETINMTMNVGGKPTLEVFSIDANGTTTILATIHHGLDARKTPVRSFYYHSFFLTKNYVVIPVSPLYYKNNGLDFLLNGSVLSGLEWEPDTPTYFHIIDRHHGKGHVATLLGPSYFAFHIVNGIDDQDANGNIIFHLDCSAYDGKMIYETHAFGNITRASDYDTYIKDSNNKATMKTHNGITYPPSHCNSFGDYRRYTLTWDPTTTTTTNPDLASFETICTNFEFPRINTAYTFKQHRYVYGCQVQNPTKERGERYALTKLDVLEQKVICYEHQDDNGYFCSEPIFVPRPPQDDDASLEEDDGVVLSLVNVYDNRGSQYDHCYLLVLDATTFDLVARINIGQYTAPTFHGSYADDSYFESGSFN